LKRIPGFSAYAILNNDGIVIKYENMSYRAAVHHAHQVLSLSGKASRYIRDLFEAPDVS
jgi:dynein light chain roadblock-type